MLVSSPGLNKSDVIPFRQMQSREVTIYNKAQGPVLSTYTACKHRNVQTHINLVGSYKNIKYS